MRHADIVGQINDKVNEQCRLAAEKVMHNARLPATVPVFSYRTPELHKPVRRPKLFNQLSKETRERIRSQFRLTEEGVAE